MSRPTPRWIAETGGTRGPSYAARFRELAASGADLNGEARFLDGLLPAPGRVLDAGCGTGRVAIELARRGHRVVGLDVDASMVAEARKDGERAGVDVRWVVGDLLDVGGLDLGGLDLGDLRDVRDLPDLDAPLGDAGKPFDLVAAPGNVMVYLAPGTEPDVVRALASVLRPGGHLVAGFAADRHVAVADYDRWCADAGLSPSARYSTWDGDPWNGGPWDGEPFDRLAPDGAYVVMVHRR